MFCMLVVVRAVLTAAMVLSVLVVFESQAGK